MTLPTAIEPRFATALGILVIGTYLANAWSVSAGRPISGDDNCQPHIMPEPIVLLSQIGRQRRRAA